ncbi:hypothetical protein TNIN_232731 [Trichonephila inaurata madagascariensis]|uniref:Uncharacterized protein n=1 Tax=Trichonephila inaurata madagascariensis TaxID=2747483 RepID=A0A8X6MD63_9ARAC|nr:hypothetical protein TNIN_232731 [Trichonephila inaurata madagascariensis]
MKLCTGISSIEPIILTTKASRPSDLDKVQDVSHLPSRKRKGGPDGSGYLTDKLRHLSRVYGDHLYPRGSNERRKAPFSAGCGVAPPSGTKIHSSNHRQQEVSGVPVKQMFRYNYRIRGRQTFRLFFFCFVFFSNRAIDSVSRVVERVKSAIGEASDRCYTRQLSK